MMLSRGPFSNFARKKFAKTGPSDDPIETPSDCLYNSLLNRKCTFIVHRKRSYFKVDAIIPISIFLFSSLLHMKSTVSIQGTFMNRDDTSGDIIDLLFTFISLILSIK
ncbi:unnamed protein product [Heterobilharzia americana]|nr:unnamed protein product [Heterobilharzia americana]